jgi:hypothetical protein
MSRRIFVVYSAAALARMEKNQQQSKPSANRGAPNAASRLVRPSAGIAGNPAAVAVQGSMVNLFIF